jgi:hypothetical protein
MSLNGVDVTVGAALVASKSYSKRVDTTNPVVTYIGDAIVGSSTSTACWKIMKIDTTTGAVITYADGNDLFDNVWDDRASLSYS